MKKATSIFLITFLIVLGIAGCSQEEDREYSIIQTSTPIESYDNESLYTPPNNDSSGSMDENSPETGFIIKDRKYSFDGNDLVIVNIKNQTNTNYSITIHGTYLDQNGEIIKTETQTFEQFAAGFENYFIFDSNTSFDHLEYFIETTEYHGHLYVNELTMCFTGYKEVLMHVQELVEQGDHLRHPAIVAEFCHKSTSATDICPTGKWVLINSNDEIVTICTIGTWLYAENVGKEEKSHFMIYYTTEEELTWPEHLKGEFKALCALEQIITDQPE